MACSWYMKLCSRVLFGWRPAAEASAAPPSPPNPPNPARLPPPPSESWNVAYGEMSSAVSVTHQRHCLPFKSRWDEFFMWQSIFICFTIEWFYFHFVISLLQFLTWTMILEKQLVSWGEYHETIIINQTHLWIFWFILLIDVFECVE